MKADLERTLIEEIAIALRVLLERGGVPPPSDDRRPTEGPPSATVLENGVPEDPVQSALALAAPLRATNREDPRQQAG